MNIAFLAPELLPNWGGADMFAIVPAKYLSKRHDEHVITLRRKIDDRSTYFGMKLCKHPVKL